MIPIRTKFYIECIFCFVFSSLAGMNSGILMAEFNIASLIIVILMIVFTGISFHNAYKYRKQLEMSQ